MCYHSPAILLAAITGATFLIADEDLESLKRVMDAEMHLLQLLRSFGGISLAQQLYMPDRVLADARTFVDTGLKTEAVFAGAYLAATHQSAVLGQPKLAAPLFLNRAVSEAFAPHEAYCSVLKSPEECERERPHGS